MRSFTLAAALIGTAVANPMPQAWDFDAIAQASPVPTADVPVVAAAAQATTVPYVSSLVAASVSSAIAASPTDPTLSRRQSADTAANWLANPQWSTDALAASTPSGYELVFQNQSGSAQNVLGYMGFAVLNSYNVSQCAANCNGITGCSSFNVYYERDPSTTPTDSNPNPSSITVVKCVYYGGVILPTEATNLGQYQEQFQVVVGGSNAYSSNAVDTPPGMSTPQYLGTSAINAPLDCNNANTYMGFKLFSDGVFNVDRCAAACSAQSAYNVAHPPKTGSAKTCQFINTYILYNNSVPTGQYCSMYSESWPASFATNNGQWRGSNHFTVAYSFSSSNLTNSGAPSGCSNPTAPSS